MSLAVAICLTAKFFVVSDGFQLILTNRTLESIKKKRIIDSVDKLKKKKHIEIYKYI